MSISKRIVQRLLDHFDDSALYVLLLRLKLVDLHLS